MVSGLTFTTLRAFSTNNNLMIFFLENRVCHFMQIVSLGDTLHEMLIPVFWNKSEKYFKMSSVIFVFFDCAADMCNNYFCKYLTHFLSLAYHKSDIGKQCKPRSDAA